MAAGKTRDAEQSPGAVDRAGQTGDRMPFSRQSAVRSPTSEQSETSPDGQVSGPHSFPNCASSARISATLLTPSPLTSPVHALGPSYPCEPTRVEVAAIEIAESNTRGDSLERRYSNTVSLTPALPSAAAYAHGPGGRILSRRACERGGVPHAPRPRRGARGGRAGAYNRTYVRHTQGARARYTCTLFVTLQLTRYWESQRDPWNRPNHGCRRESAGQPGRVRELSPDRVRDDVHI